MDRLTYLNNKIVDRHTAVHRIRSWKLKGNQVVFTNGCFDILHRGHVSYLAQAASLGNRLVLAINTDASVKRLGKGDDRPVNDEVSRAIVAAGLGFVDLVVSFDEDTPYELIKLLEPDILVKGGDYSEDQEDPSMPNYIVGSDLVRQSGGQVKTIPLVDGFSTTSIIEKLRNR